MKTDLLANVERPTGDKPAAKTEPVSFTGYWLGSAGQWRARALAAEAALAALRAKMGAVT
jgi:hypothetical protein